MIVTFWGVRGSVATPGPQTVRYGGNTSCVGVEIDDKVLILDAGTGIRSLGTALAGGGQELFLLITHLHADHLSGFPYFDPLYEEGRVVHLLDYPRSKGGWSLLRLLNGVHFPLRPEDLRCDYRRVEGDAPAYLRAHGFDVQALPVNHPGGAYGYRLTHQGRSFVFIPDNELDASEQSTSFADLAAFCRDADVLCHDAQYLDADLPAKHGWGHSRVRRTCDLAVAAGVRRLILFHHDPDRDDDALDRLQAAARERLAPHGALCDAAREGMRLDLSA